MPSRAIEIYTALLFAGMLGLSLMVARGAAQIPYGAHAAPVFVALAVLALLPGAAWLRAYRSRTALLEGKPLHMRYGKVPRETAQTFLGLGFLWTPVHAERLTSILSKCAGAPEEVQIASGGNTLIHGLGLLTEKPIFLGDEKRCHHTIVFGSPGSGKTRFIELMIRQMIEKGDIVVVVDPKGDSRLINMVEQACRETGRGEQFRLVALPWPKSSAAYNPLTNFTTPSEIADRLIGILPPSTGDGEAFRGFQWGATKAVVQALYLADRPITIARVLEGLRDMSPVTVALVKRRFPDLAADDVAQIASKYEASVASGGMARSAELDDLLSYLKLDVGYYQKMVASFIPQLERLSAGPKRELLSPEPESVKREILTWGAVDHQKLVVYFYLGSLHGEESANAVGKMLLLDFQAYIAKRYSYGGAAASTQISFVVDEAHHMISKSFMNILAEARGANIGMVLASQTTAQFEMAFGERAAVDEILTMAYAYIQFQGRNHHEAETFSELAGERLMRVVGESYRYEPGFFSSGLSNVDDFRAAYTQSVQFRDAPIVPPWAITQLPVFHFMARVGGRIYKGRIPLLEQPTSTFTRDVQEGSVDA